jgi:Dna[CI] antecedent, DciA
LLNIRSRRLGACRLAFLGFSTDAFSRLRPPFKYIPPPGSEKVSARRRVLAQWRGVDLAPLEAAQAMRARRVSDVLPWVTKDLHMDRRRAEAEVVKVWNSLIDPNIVTHAQPVGVRKGTLFVTVDSSVWLSEIVRYRRKEILDRLQHSFGRELIQRISFRVG